MEEERKSLNCTDKIYDRGVVAFVEAGRSLNALAIPGNEIDLLYDGTRIGTGRVLAVVVGGLGDVPDQILAYNQNRGARTHENLRFDLGFPPNDELSEVTVVLVDVTALNNAHIYAAPEVAIDERYAGRPEAAAAAEEAAIAERDAREVTEDDELDEADAEDGDADAEDDEDDEDDAEDILDDILEKFEETPGGN